MENEESDIGKYSVDASGATGVVIGDRARVIQNISNVYNVNSAQEGIRRIRATLKERLRDLIEQQTPFGGRDEELKRLDSLLLAPAGYQFVTGPSGFGKTALLSNWLLQLQQRSYTPCYHFISRREGLADEEFAMRNLCQQLIFYHELDGDLPSSAGELRSLYRQLLLIPPPQGQNLIVIIDGLDEALGWAAGPDLFPRPLPEGVYVAFSARALPEKDWLLQVGLGSAGMEPLFVSSMGIKEISDLLKKAGGRALALYANANFLKTIHTKSEGDPFYLHFLVEDIQTGEVTAENIADQPTGLSAYLRGWWEQLSDDVELERKEVYDLLGILTVAVGPVNRKDLAGMSQTLSRGALLKKELSGQLRRYLTGDQDKGYVLGHHRFAEYLAKEAFLPEEVKEYRKQVVDYCGRWSEHHSSYALSYYPKHLLEAGRLNDLYALISKPWMQALFEDTGSHRQFVSDVELVLTAAESEKPRNWVQVSRLALVIATVMEIAGNAPLTALAALVLVGKDAKAWSYAALQSNLRKPEAYLRIGKAHQSRDQRERARKALALSLLAATEDMVFFSLQAQALLAASLVLAQLGDHETAITVADLVMEIAQTEDDSTRSSSTVQAAEVFTAAGRLELLEELVLKADSIKEAGQKAQAMARISEAFQTVGERKRSAELAELAVGAVQGTEAAIELPIFADVAELLSKLDEEPRSRELADTVLNRLEELKAWAKPEVLMNLVMVYARSDDNLVLNRVLDIARAVNDEWHSVSTMCLVAEALAKCGELVKAHEFAQQAVDSTKHPKAQESNPSLLISNAADALYRASEFDLGRLLADTIVDSNARASALGQVATALAEAGDTENAEKLGADALSMVETLTPDRSKAAAFASFSSALEDQGRHDTAREIANAALQVAQAIASDTERADALVKAYEALKKVGANEAADKTAEMVLEIAEHPSDYSRTSERCALAKALASTGDTKEAQRVAEIALSGVTESLEWDERAKQLKLVADVMISAGAVNRAVEIAEEALMCTRSEWFKTYPLQEASEISDLAILFAKIGKTETALQLVARCLAILEPFESNLVYKNLAIQASAEAISTLGRFDQAVETVKGMEMDPEGRGVALLRIAEILISSGCEAKAIELIEEAKNVAGTSWWAPNWSEISRLMSLAGRREDALTYLVKALRSAKFSRPRVLSALASGSALLSTMDQGGTLCHIYESVNEVDGWWRVAQ